MVAVALPALSAAFGAPAASVTVFVVTGYLVATIVSQMPAGSVADRIGYARALDWGRWIFGAGAVLGMFAPTLGAVVAGRLLMAVGGALIVPTAMALLRVAVPEERRTRAFGTMGAVMGGAAAVGPALGAWMVAQFGWRSLFVVNLPLLFGSWLMQPRLPDDAVRTPRPSRGFDWPGSLLIAVALLLVTFSSRVDARLGFILAAAAIAAFIALVWQERRAASPVLNLSLFGNFTFVAGAGVIATQNLAMYSLLVQVPFLFGSGSQSDPRLGLAIVAMSATMAAAAPAGGILAERLGVRAVIGAGGAIAAAGVITIGQLPPDATALAIGLRLLLVGGGLGISTGPANAAAIGAVAPQLSATAAATVSLLRYLGAIAGTVVLSYAFAGGADVLARHHVALWIFVGALLCSAALGLSLPRLAAAPAPNR